MLTLGKAIRMERIFSRTTGNTIIIPMDHGVSGGTPKGLEDSRQVVCDMAQGGADAVLMNKGLVGFAHRRSGTDLGLIVQLSASTRLRHGSFLKTLVCTVEEALKLGADCVSIQVNLGCDDEDRMLADFGKVSETCNEWGMPLLAMISARSPHISDSYAPEVIAHCARLGAELGADIVLVSYTGDPESFARVVEECPAPVLIAGGERLRSTKQVLERVYDALQAGARGIAMGRNVFQHPSRVQMIRALHSLVHENRTVDEALSLIDELPQ